MLNILRKFLSLPFSLYVKMRNKVIFPQGTIVYGDGSNLKIGQNVSFGGRVVLFGTAPITIGDNTMIALNTIIHTSTHDYNDHPMWRKRIDRPVQIGMHVWIGAAAIILPGVIIGDYAVIGSGSVVTANVPEGAVVVGNPARIIGFRETDTYQREPEIVRWSDSQIVAETFGNKSCKRA